MTSQLAPCLITLRHYYLLKSQATLRQELFNSPAPSFSMHLLCGLQGLCSTLNQPAYSSVKQAQILAARKMAVVLSHASQQHIQ
jgi:hypothetical protein